MAFSCVRRGSGWALEAFLLGKGGEALARAVQGGVESPSWRCPGTAEMWR